MSANTESINFDLLIPSKVYSSCDTIPLICDRREKVLKAKWVSSFDVYSGFRPKQCFQARKREILVLKNFKLVMRFSCKAQVRLKNCNNILCTNCTKTKLHFFNFHNNLLLQVFCTIHFYKKEHNVDAKSENVCKGSARSHVHIGP